MSRSLNFTLTVEERVALKQAITSSPTAEVRQRVIAIRLLHFGQLPHQLAQAVMVTSNTIYAWHKRWREHGVAVLRDGHRTGCPAKAEANYKTPLNMVLEQDPRDLGLTFTIWTIDRLRVYLSEQTGILLSSSRLRALLTREGYRWKEPKHDLSHLQDRPVQETTEQVTVWLIKTSRSIPSPKRSISLWTKRTVSLHPPLRRCWMKRGERKFIPPPGTLQHLHVFDAYNWRNLHLTYAIAGRKNSETFIAFLEQLLAQYPRQQLVLVMDNASHHRSKTTRAALSLYDNRLLVIWLPKCSPFLNPIEQFWRHFKQLDVANRLYTLLTDLLQTFDSVMADQNTLNHPNRLSLLDKFRLVA